MQCTCSHLLPVQTWHVVQSHQYQHSITQAVAVGLASAARKGAVPVPFTSHEGLHLAFPSNNALACSLTLFFSPPGTSPNRCPCSLNPSLSPSFSFLVASNSDLSHGARSAGASGHTKLSPGFISIVIFFFCDLRKSRLVRASRPTLPWMM